MPQARNASGSAASPSTMATPSCVATADVSGLRLMGEDDDLLAQAVELFQHAEAELLQPAHHDVALQLPHAR